MVDFHFLVIMLVLAVSTSSCLEISGDVHVMNFIPVAYNFLSSFYFFGLQLNKVASSQLLTLLLLPFSFSSRHLFGSEINESY